MASLNNIFLVLFLFLNIFILFTPINCTDCLQKNEINCNNKNNKCCSALNCKTKANGHSFCRPYNCVKQGAQCDITKDKYCCYGSFCSSNTKKCETCLKKFDPCGNDGNTFKGCDGLECNYIEKGSGVCSEIPI